MDGMTTGVGTPEWAPPEDQVGMAAGTAGDVWSAGVMLREMAIGSRAWEAGNALGGRLAHIVGVMEPPPPNYAEVLPAPLHVYAGAYLAAVAERGGHARHMGSLQSSPGAARALASGDGTHDVAASAGCAQDCQGADGFRVCAAEPQGQEARVGESMPADESATRRGCFLRPSSCGGSDHDGRAPRFGPP